MKPLSMPINVFLCVTNKCNFSCKHCNVFLTRDSDELTTEEILGLLSYLARRKVFHLVISGGEPFAQSDIFTILDFISTLPLRFQINTNAALINDSIAQRLNRNKRLDSILVGFDGSSPATYDKLRGEGGFKKALRGLQSLARYFKGSLCLFTVVNKHNFRDLANIAALAKSLGILKVQFEPLFIEGNAICHSQELALDEAQTIFVYDSIKMLSREFGKLIGGNYYTMGEMFRGWDKDRPVKISAKAKGLRLLNCEGTIKKITIRPDGWVTPCDRLWDFKLGNIRTQSLDEIWLRSPAIQEFRDRFSHTVDERAECAACAYRQKCGGGCPAVPFYMGRGIVGLDPTSCYALYKKWSGDAEHSALGRSDKEEFSYAC